MPAVELFRVVGLGIERLVDSICAARSLDQPSVIKEACSKIRQNRAEYYENMPDPQYADPFAVVGYLHCLAVAHGFFAKRTFEHFPELLAVVERAAADPDKWLEVCAFGGGPCPELLGVLKLLEARRLITGHQVFVNFRSFDQIEDWDQACTALHLALRRQMKTAYGANEDSWPFKLNWRRSRLDLTQDECGYLPYDVAIVSYILSELSGARQRVEQFFVAAVRRARPGTLFLFMDKDDRPLHIGPAVRARMGRCESMVFTDRIIAAAGLQSIGVWLPGQLSVLDEEADPRKTDPIWDTYWTWRGEQPQLNIEAFAHLAVKP